MPSGIILSQQHQIFFWSTHLMIYLSIKVNYLFIKLNTYCVPTPLPGARTASPNTARFLLSQSFHSERRAHRWLIHAWDCGIPLSAALIPMISLSSGQILNRKFQNKPLQSGKLHTFLNSLEKSCAVPFCPTWVMNHFFVPCICAVDSSCPLVIKLSPLSQQLLRYHSACVQLTFILFTDGP